MDTRSGHIYDLNTMEIPSVKGKMVEWKVGEKVEVKGCLFEVVEIKCIPEDKIVLKGMAREQKLNHIKELSEKIPMEDSQNPNEALREFLRLKK